MRGDGCGGLVHVANVREVIESDLVNLAAKRPAVRRICPAADAQIRDVQCRVDCAVPTPIGALDAVDIKARLLGAVVVGQYEMMPLL